MEDERAEDWLKDLPLQTENIAYKPEEMIECARCRRSNPPNRLQCFYCGNKLEIGESQSLRLKPHLRKLEDWEKGFNIIFQAISAKFDETKLPETMRLLNLESGIIKLILSGKRRLPLARVESETAAKIIRNQLLEAGIETTILSDESLAAEKNPARLREIEFGAEELILKTFSGDEIIKISADDLILIVVGSVFARKIAATEEYNKKGDNKILETSESFSDETVVDVYRRQDCIGFRILATGFDFSTLGNEKSLLAKDNIKKLVENLRLFAPESKYVDDYSAARQHLSAVWAVEQKTDSQGIKRGSVGKYNIGNVTTINNLSQFTRYSRLQRNLL